MSDFWKTLLATLLGTALGGGLSILAAYLTFSWGVEQQRKLTVAKALGEFIVSDRLALPRPDVVPQECQARLESCRISRSNAIQTYMFAPSNILADLAKSYGGSKSPASKPPSEELALVSMIKRTREWLSGEVDANFDFILPCAVWKVEQELCTKK